MFRGWMVKKGTEAVEGDLAWHLPVSEGWTPRQASVAWSLSGTGGVL